MLAYVLSCTIYSSIYKIFHFIYENVVNHPLQRADSSYFADSQLRWMSGAEMSWDVSARVYLALTDN